MSARHYPDPTKTNCRRDNLLWGTLRDNYFDWVKDGGGNHGERCGSAKLTEAIVVAVKQRLINGESQTNIAASIGIARQSVSDIHLGKTWKHVL